MIINGTTSINKLILRGTKSIFSFLVLLFLYPFFTLILVQYNFVISYSFLV